MNKDSMSVEEFDAMKIPEEHRFSERYLQKKQKILAGIPEKNHKRVVAIIAGVAAAAVIVVVSGFLFGWFGNRKYTVTLANGDEIIYRKDGHSFGAFDLWFDCPTSRRELMESEVKSVFPEGIVPDRAYAVFNSDTGELLHMEASFNKDNMSIYYDVDAGRVTDYFIGADKTTSLLNGIPVSAFYYITDANSSGKRELLVGNSFQVGSIYAYLCMGGDPNEIEAVCQRAADITQRIIDNGDTGFKSVSMGDAISSDQRKRDSGPSGKLYEYQTIKIISEDYLNNDVVKKEYTLSSADASRLMNAIDPEGRTYSEDVIKSEFERSYTIVIDDSLSFSLGRDVENGTDSVYMFDLRSTPVSGTYISSDIVKMIDEIIAGNISLQKEKAKENTTVEGLMIDATDDPTVYDQEILEFGIRMEVENPNTSGCDLKFIYTENGQTDPIEFIVGEGYYFQKWEEDHWGRLLTNYSYGVVEKGYGVPTTLQVRWNKLFGEQSPGVYRIIAPVAADRRLRNYKVFYISCIFEIE